MSEDAPDTAAAGDAEPARSLAQQAIATPSPAAAESRHRAERGRDFEFGQHLFNPARFRPYQRRPNDPLYRPLRIYTRDPIRSRFDGAESEITLRFEPLRPGPEGALLRVADRELTGTASDGTRLYSDYPGVDLDDKAQLINRGRAPSPGDIFFHQQMVYAVASKVIERFTLALGRDPSWGFNRVAPGPDGKRVPPTAATTRLPPGAEGDKLRLLPHYNRDRNANYDSATGELRFGYFDAVPNAGAAILPRGTVYACLSQDIIAHEMAHALLDGMRGRFTDPTGPDVLALHEAFADLVAILQACGDKESIKRVITDNGGELRAGQLFDLAEQFGRASGAAGALRRADLDDDPLDYETIGDAPHVRGQVLAGAVLEAMITIYERRSRRLRRLYRLADLPAGVSLDADYAELLAETASKVAGHFMALIIRAIDYCPPIDITFGEFLRALLTADRDLVEDDVWGYRGALVTAFGRRRIFPDGVRDLSEDSLLWRPPTSPLPRIPALDMASIRFRADPGISVAAEEIETQALALASFVTDPRYTAEFGLIEHDSPEFASADVTPPVIESIRTIRRVGPDRQVRFGLVAEVLQEARLEIAGRAITMVGGSTIVIGGEGEVRFVIRKRLTDRNRARRQATYQASGIGRFQTNAAATGNLWVKLHASG